MNLGPFLDLVQFLGLTSAVTYALVDAPAAGVLGFLAWGALVGRRDPRPGGETETGDGHLAREMNLSPSLCFEAAKLAGGLAGIAALLAGAPAGVLRLVLALNMAEAVAWDAWACARTGQPLNAAVAWDAWACARTGQPLNAAVGSLLIADLLARDLDPLALPLSWVLGYSAWNAAFSLGFGYSHTTRAMLATALLVHLGSGGTRPWLACRCLSLVANMVLRATHAATGLRVYTPGATWLTKDTPRA